MRVFLHIGAPKTGTSAIQYFMNTNRPVLERLGFYYPEHHLDQNNVSGGHTDLGVSLIEKDMVRARQIVEGRLKEAEERQCHLVLSGESFYGFFKELKELFSGHSVYIISYYRDPLESLISNHNQVVKRHFEIRNLNEYLSTFIGQPAYGFSGEVLFKWHSLFGKERLHVWPYSKNAFPGGSIEYSFLSILGINEAEWCGFVLRQGGINSSYTDEALELKRLLNHVLGMDDHHINAQLDWSMQKYSDNAGSAAGEKTFPRVKPEILTELAEQFAAPKRQVINEFLAFKPADFSEKVGESLSFGRLGADGGERLKKVISVWEAVKANLPDIATRIEERVASATKQKQAPFALFRLADVMGLDYSEPKTDIGIPPSALKVFTNEKAGIPDFLRELTKVLVDQGRDEEAYALIKRAVALRPKGPALIKLHEEIAARLEGGCS
ncbi:hypothetical protein LL254_07040 [Marinobacter nauticus]|uniref:hypothetical protein n=1 Tax=Marinobacter nauticus TaxID=2743 RepID=UPI001D1909C8|nr:hypothetical protein [Marinobacter nauticus]MCC4270462.1 hypothetical protein [Marinobacter nauticus]